MEENGSKPSQDQDASAGEDEQLVPPVVDELVECATVTLTTTTESEPGIHEPADDGDTQDSSLLVGTEDIIDPNLSLLSPESIKPAKNPAEPEAEADHVMEAHVNLPCEPEEEPDSSFDLSCSETIPDDASPIPDLDTEDTTQDDLESSRNLTTDISELELQLDDGKHSSGLHCNISQLRISDTSLVSKEMNFSNTVQSTRNGSVKNSVGDEPDSLNMEVETCETSEVSSNMRQVTSESEPSVSLYEPASKDTEPMDVDMKSSDSAPEAKNRKTESSNSEFCKENISESSQITTEPASTTVDGNEDEDSLSNKKAAPSSPGRSTPSPRKIPTRNTRSAPMLRKRRRRRLMTRQRQTSISALNKQKATSLLGKRSIGRNEDSPRGEQSDSGKPTPKKIVRRRKLGSNKQEKSNEQAEEELERPSLTPKRTLLSAAVLMYSGTMYHIGDVIQVLGDDDLIYYAQILRFITDDYCEKFIQLRWLVPRQDVPMKNYHSNEFNPLYFALGPSQEDPISMRDIEFVMRAPRDLGPGQIEPTFNKCGEHAVVFNTNVPENTLTSIANCKL